MRGIREAILMGLILISFTVYLKSGKVFKTQAIDVASHAGYVYFLVDNKGVYVPLANIDYIKED